MKNWVIELFRWVSEITSVEVTNISSKDIPLNWTRVSLRNFKTGFFNITVLDEELHQKFEFYNPIFPKIHIYILFGILCSTLLKSRMINNKNVQTTINKCEENEEKPYRSLEEWSEYRHVRILFSITCLIVTILLAPVIIIVLLIFKAYRKLIQLILRVRFGDKFVGLLEGTDAIWALEDMNTSVINALGIIQVNSSVTKQYLLNKIRNTFSKNLFRNPLLYPKIFYNRKYFCGYSYWKMHDSVRVEDYINVLPEVGESNDYVTESVLRGLISSLSNQKLPNNHQMSWQVLVGSQILTDDKVLIEENEDETVKFPILFRIHHSLGDGVALIKLLLETVADDDLDFKKNSHPEKCDINPIQKELTINSFSGVTATNSIRMIDSLDEMTAVSSEANDDNLIPCQTNKNVTKSYSLPLKMNNLQRFKSFDSTYSISKKYERYQSLQEIFKIEEHHELDIFTSKYSISINDNSRKVSHTISNNAHGSQTDENNIQSYGKIGRSIFKFFEKVFVIFLAPASLINQALLKSIDRNELHNSTLTTEKVVAWISEKENDEFKMLSKLKAIKNRIPGARFSDVILTALSAGFYSYFEKMGKGIPSAITAVIPARMDTTFSNQSKDNNLAQKETVSGIGGYVSVPTNDVIELTNRFSVGLLTIPIARDTNLIERMTDIKQHSEMLRHSPDFLVNYWIMRTLSSTLPEPLLKPVVFSSHSTIVVSNLPGPSQVTVCGGYLLDDLIFWIPNRGSTGIGISILSYAGRLQLGIQADRGILKCPQDAHLLLEEIVKELQRMDQITTNTIT